MASRMKLVGPFDIVSFILSSSVTKTPRIKLAGCFDLWLGAKESNLYIQIQSLLSYH